MSDSHGRHNAVRRALARFDELGVQEIIHCGDVGGMSVFDELAGRKVSFVWGNTDEPDQALIAYIVSIGLALPGTLPLRLSLDGKQLAVFHGHESNFDAAVSHLAVDYILHGHTHVPRNETIRDRRIINPGALHRAPRKTVATLDVSGGRVDFHAIDGI